MTGWKDSHFNTVNLYHLDRASKVLGFYPEP